MHQLRKCHQPMTAQKVVMTTPIVFEESPSVDNFISFQSWVRDHTALLRRLVSFFHLFVSATFSNNYLLDHVPNKSLYERNL